MTERREQVENVYNHLKDCFSLQFSARALQMCLIHGRVCQMKTLNSEEDSECCACKIEFLGSKSIKQNVCCHELPSGQSV